MRCSEGLVLLGNGTITPTLRVVLKINYKLHLVAQSAVIMLTVAGRVSIGSFALHHPLMLPLGEFLRLHVSRPVS